MVFSLAENSSARAYQNSEAARCCLLGSAGFEAFLGKLKTLGCAISDMAGNEQACDAAEESAQSVGAGAVEIKEIGSVAAFTWNHHGERQRRFEVVARIELLGRNQDFIRVSMPTRINRHVRHAQDGLNSKFFLRPVNVAFGSWQLGIGKLVDVARKFRCVFRNVVGFL